MMGQPVLSVVNSHAQPILVSVSFLFFVIFNYQAFHKTLRKGLIQILLGVTDYWGNFDYCNCIATGDMDIATVLQ